MSLGIVEIYNFPAFIKESSSLKPWKTIMNVTTAVDIMKFHPSSQLLVIGSSVSWNSVRLVHIPSGRIFSNWPHSSFPLGHISDLDFNHDGTLLMLSARNGKIRLFSLTHFVRKSRN
jgi:U3 small nucleolar RNA-associated protein 18